MPIVVFSTIAVTHDTMSHDRGYRIVSVISLGVCLLAIVRGRRGERFRSAQILKVGMLVRIHDFDRNPLAGRTGTIIAISSSDPFGAYLVEFEDGLRFRYKASEFALKTYPEAVQESLPGVGV